MQSWSKPAHIECCFAACHHLKQKNGSYYKVKECNADLLKSVAFMSARREGNSGRSTTRSRSRAFISSSLMPSSRAAKPWHSQAQAFGEHKPRSEHGGYTVEMTPKALGRPEVKTIKLASKHMAPEAICSSVYAKCTP